MSTPLPDDEEERLAELQEYDILDTPPEGIYDDLTFLASQITGTKIAAITLIDEDRQWLKARQGPIEKETPREDSFCAHAIIDPDDLMVVEDALEDERFQDNPMVLGDPEIRFYAGAPLETPSGRALGSICAIDDEPRELTDEQARSLEALSRMVMTQLELRRRSKELRRTKEALEERTADLERINASLDRFAGVVSHELKDPLSQVMGNLDLVASGPSDLEEEDRELLASAIQGAERMDDLIEDLLRYSRARGGEVDAETVDMEAIVDRVRDELSHDIEAVGATLEVGDLPPAEADPDLVRQLVQNLVKNALKYGGDGPRIEVRSEGLEDGFHRFVVADDGPGIPEEEQEGLFGLFQQASVGEEGEGTGVGLALCERIVERHGGTIGVDSAKGEGAAFWFTLPSPEET